MDERLKCVARRLAGEPMSELCREFGISRKTGYKIFDRDQQCGVQGLTDRSRRPYRYAHQLPFQVENYILNLNCRYFDIGSPAGARFATFIQKLRSEPLSTLRMAPKMLRICVSLGSGDFV